MKSCRWKRWGFLLGTLAIILIIIVLVLPGFLDPNRYHDLIVSEIEEAVGGRVSLGHLSWGISKGIWVNPATPFTGLIPSLL